MEKRELVRNKKQKDKKREMHELEEKKEGLGREKCEHND